MLPLSAKLLMIRISGTEGIYMETKQRRPLLDILRPNLVWIIAVLIIWYIFIAGIAHLFWDEIINVFADVLSPAMRFTVELYASTIVDIIVLFMLCWFFVKNRYVWKSFLLPAGSLEFNRGDIVTEDDAYAELYGRRRNGLRMLGLGLLLGFLTNFFCIICALIHGDIKLYFDCTFSQIPYFLFSLFCVCIQSSSEELWCRGFLYERLHERYPLWVAIAVNGILFGLLHIFNPSVSTIPILGIIICGISYSLLRWYSGNIWIAMGIHTGWNFTQNYLFGLPNSGLVSEASVFHLDAANASSSLIYDWGFGVEGGLPALFIDAFLGAVIIYLALKSGRIRELGMNRPAALENMGLKMHETVQPQMTEAPADPEDSEIAEAHADSVDSADPVDSETPADPEAPVDEITE